MDLFSDTLLSICLGLGLSAATGFRVFVPLLLLNLASRGGWLELSQQFAWMGGAPALAVFGIATAIEIGAYYVPWLDNLIDSSHLPTAARSKTARKAREMLARLAPGLPAEYANVRDIVSARIAQVESAD